MILARIKQGIRFLFGKYENKNDIEVKKVLSEEEFEIFSAMSEYEKIHSFRLYKMVVADNLLGGLKEYQKLALLHDCGKDNKTSFFKRVKKVVIGDKELDRHALASFEKLKTINKDVAELSKAHHDDVENIYMKRFQELDDK